MFSVWRYYRRAFVPDGRMIIENDCLNGKELVILDKCDTSKTCGGCGNKQAMPLWKKISCCRKRECRLIMDRDENSAVTILKRYLAWLELYLYSEHQRCMRSSLRSGARKGRHTDDPMWCADVFTATEYVLTPFQKAGRQ